MYKIIVRHNVHLGDISVVEAIGMIFTVLEVLMKDNIKIISNICFMYQVVS